MIQYFFAFAGGLITFVSPCILPMVPIYLAYLSGTSFAETSAGLMGTTRSRLIVASIFFILGFTVVFTALAVLLNIIAQSLGMYRIWLIRFSGAVVVLFGLHTLRVLRIPFLNQEARIYQKNGNSVKSNPLAAFLLGFFFALGWSPCVGPVLSGILFSSSSGSLAAAIVQLVLFSAGIGIPFIVSGLFTVGILSLFKRIEKWSRRIETIAGIFLVVLGLMLLLNLMPFVSGFFDKIFPGLGALEYKLK